jgi:hypothetical protein
MYKCNNTKEFMEDLPPEVKKFIRQSARLLDSSQLEKQNLVNQGKADQNIGTAKKTQRIAKKTKKEAARKALAKRLREMVPNTDIDSSKKAAGTIPVIELQLEWHRAFDSNVPNKSTLSNKVLKLEALISAVEHLNSGQVVRPTSPIIESPEDDLMDVDNVDTEEEMEDEDTDMDY